MSHLHTSYMLGHLHQAVTDHRGFAVLNIPGTSWSIHMYQCTKYTLIHTHVPVYQVHTDPYTCTSVPSTNWSIHIHVPVYQVHTDPYTCTSVPSTHWSIHRYQCTKYTLIHTHVPVYQVHTDPYTCTKYALIHTHVPVYQVHTDPYTCTSIPSTHWSIHMYQCQVALNPRQQKN